MTFLGVGSAFAKRNYQSNALVEAWSDSPATQATPDANLLIDFGTTGPLALWQLKDKKGFEYLGRGGEINYRSIQRIFITHTHSDHVGGLEEMVQILTYHDSTAEAMHRPELLATQSILDRLWEHTLRGGLDVRHGRAALLTDYFEVNAVDLGTRLPAFNLLGRYDFFCFATDHLRLASKHDWPSCGLLIQDRHTHQSCYYSGDGCIDLNAVALIENASIIFHEAVLQAATHSVHTSLLQLRSLPEQVRKRMYLYHYDDAWDDPAFEYVSREFAGFARPGQRYTALA